MPATPIREHVVVLLEDQPSIQKDFKDYFEDNNLNADLICFSTPDEYKQGIEEESTKSRLRTLIFDLANTPAEQGSEKLNDFAAVDFINSQYENNRIPIFVHSSKLRLLDLLEDRGTVWKMEKSDVSVGTVCDKIKLMLETDFLNIFCPNGKLEIRIMKEIHEAFVNQFKKNEIEEIIKSIKGASEDDCSDRVAEVFERIAIRSVYENWVSASREANGNMAEKKFNAIEHYYRRTSEYEVWTGDVFAKTEADNDLLVVLTPRCNIGHENYEELLLCRILELEGERLNSLLSKNGQKNLKRNITDDVKLTEERYRFLPPTPQFRGGVVDFRATITMKKDDFLQNYALEISLSDELANDIVRKFTSYLSRGGISETEFTEAYYYVLNSQNEAPDEAKPNRK